MRSQDAYNNFCTHERTQDFKPVYKNGLLWSMTPIPRYPRHLFPFPIRMLPSGIRRKLPAYRDTILAKLFKGIGHHKRDKNPCDDTLLQAHTSRRFLILWHGSSQLHTGSSVRLLLVCFGWFILLIYTEEMRTRCKIWRFWDFEERNDIRIAKMQLMGFMFTVICGCSRQDDVHSVALPEVQSPFCLVIKRRTADSVRFFDQKRIYAFSS